MSGLNNPLATPENIYKAGVRVFESIAEIKAASITPTRIVKITSGNEYLINGVQTGAEFELNNGFYAHLLNDDLLSSITLKYSTDIRFDTTDPDIFKTRWYSNKEIVSSGAAWIKDGSTGEPSTINLFDGRIFNANGIGYIYRYLTIIPCQFGAVGDDTSDIADTAAFKAAFKFAKKTSRDIFAGAGNFRINETLELSGETRGFTFSGVDEWSTIFTWTGGALPMFILGGATVTNFADHINYKNFQIRNAGEGTYGIKIARSTFQANLKNIRGSNSSKAWSVAAVALSNEDESYPVRTTIENVFIDGTNSDGIAQDRGIWIQSGIQVVIKSTHVQDCNVCYQLGIDGSEVAEYGATRNLSSVYIQDNSRGQIGDRGGVVAGANCIWITDCSDGQGGFVEPTNISIDSSQFYTSNNLSETPDQLGMKCDAAVNGLVITNNIYDGAFRSNYGIRFNTTGVRGYLDCCTNSRHDDHLISMLGDMPEFGIGRIFDNSSTTGDDQIATSHHGCASVYGGVKYKTLNGKKSLEFSRINGGQEHPIGYISHSGSGLALIAENSLYLGADYNNDGLASVSEINFMLDGSIKSRIKSDGSLIPENDRASNIGSVTNRYSTLYAETGVINTSDEREKTELIEANETERAIALELKRCIRKFKFTKSVELKGEENARIHFGIGAQTVKSIFDKHGLDANEYALFCYDYWDNQVTQESKDRDPELTIAAGDRFGIRYEELVCFILAAI